ncbi:hypothetical protein L211DRAFT_135427 [Terfezia boudieri ATCC MYA-4762]|uniref:Uncharacterized protein n=1 Tax=Terfezia boudieri ATCC MYA-4762 TaxID=1051890 RepID=A0A3N4LQ48_9PEZI|nr:hypothetical protein L211DRAFT_135427 [Terfezia boudieri ATCC MYA-4762]
MAPRKLTVLIPLTILMFGASAAPVARPANVPGPAVPGPNPQKRGYDGDWLFSREADSATMPEGKLVVVTGAAEKRDYDGNWLHSRQSVNTEPEEAGAEPEN